MSAEQQPKQQPKPPQRAELRQAVALRYDADAAGAPKVVAKGQGLVAEAIVARAKEAGVYVHESPQLVQLLMAVDLDTQIPPALYTAVAELLAWLWRLEAGGEQKDSLALHLP